MFWTRPKTGTIDGSFVCVEGGARILRAYQPAHVRARALPSRQKARKCFGYIIFSCCPQEAPFLRYRSERSLNTRKGQHEVSGVGLTHEARGQTFEDNTKNNDTPTNLDTTIQAAWCTLLERTQSGRRENTTHGGHVCTSRGPVCSDRYCVCPSVCRAFPPDTLRPPCRLIGETRAYSAPTTITNFIKVSTAVTRHLAPPPANGVKTAGMHKKDALSSPLPPLWEQCSVPRDQRPRR